MIKSIIEIAIIVFPIACIFGIVAHVNNWSSLITYGIGSILGFIVSLIYALNRKP